MFVFRVLEGCDELARLRRETWGRCLSAASRCQEDLATLARRSRVAWKMLRRARVYEFILSGDVGENRRILGEFARGLDRPAPERPGS